nr:MAG TPA: hypothetical protein [Caudoviricetes sp.]
MYKRKSGNLLKTSAQFKKGGWWDSNPRHSEPQAEIFLSVIAL